MPAEPTQVGRVVEELEVVLFGAQAGRHGSPASGTPDGEVVPVPVPEARVPEARGRRVILQKQRSAYCSHCEVVFDQDKILVASLDKKVVAHATECDVVADNRVVCAMHGDRTLERIVEAVIAVVCLLPDRKKVNYSVQVQFE